MPTAPLLAMLVAASAPGPRVVLAPEVARPGDAVLVRIRAPADAAAPAASLAGRALRFWDRGPERWAIAALPLETPAGALALELAAGAPAEAAVRLEVVEPRFPSRTLQVAAKFIEPPARVQKRIAADRRAFAAAYDRPFSPPKFSGNFEWPRRARANGRFGDQRVFNGKVESVHYGIDIDGERGAPVRAANDGEVVLARDCYLSGKTVVLWHGADLFTLYFHLDRIRVRAGAKVRKGDRIGAIGSTGRSTGPHLHWSARAAGLLVDPESLLGIDFVKGSAPPRPPGPPPSEPREEPPAPAAPPEAVQPPAPVGPAPVPDAAVSGGAPTR